MADLDLKAICNPPERECVIYRKTKNSKIIVIIRTTYFFTKLDVFTRK